jgi:hypothetical protein
VGDADPGTLRERRHAAPAAAVHAPKRGIPPNCNAVSLANRGGGGKSQFEPEWPNAAPLEACAETRPDEIVRPEIGSAASGRTGSCSRRRVRKRLEV